MDDLAPLLVLQERYHSELVALNEGSERAVYFDLTRVFPETDKLPELLTQTDELKACLDSFRPMPPEQVADLERGFDLRYTYDSNRIEGNTLTLQETFLVIEKGLTISGKPMKEHLEAINHQEAVGYIRDLARENTLISETLVKKIHALILKSIRPKDAGFYRSVPVTISGSRHEPPQPFMVPKLMEEYAAFYEAAKDRSHPVILAAEMHERLVTIHPFVDGNGRTARLVMNLVLLQNGFPITNLSGDTDERLAYYAALETGNTDGDKSDFLKLIAKTVKSALIGYLNLMQPDVEQGRGGVFLRRIYSS